MTHVSRLPRHDFSYGNNDTVANAVKRLQDLQPQWELRQRRDITIPYVPTFLPVFRIDAKIIGVIGVLNIITKYTG